MRTLIAWLLMACPAFAQLDDPIVYIDQPTGSDGGFRHINPDNAAWYRASGGKLTMLMPDGTKRTLDDEVGATDPMPDRFNDLAVDGTPQWCWYSKRASDGMGYSVYRINVNTGQILEVINWKDVWTPARSELTYTDQPRPPAGQFNRWRATENFNEYGVTCYYPCPIPGGVVFVCNGDYITHKRRGVPGFQLWRADFDGNFVERVAHFNIGHVDSPFLHTNGQLSFMTAEHQGLRIQRWSIWKINPDGTNFEPFFYSSRASSTGFHAQTEMSDGTIVSVYYYDKRGSGGLVAAPPFHPSPFGPKSPFMGGPTAGDEIGGAAMQFTAQIRREDGDRRGGRRSLFWTPVGTYGITPQMNEHDLRTGTIDGLRVGRGAFPSGAPGNQLLLTVTERDKSEPGDNGGNGIYLIEQPELAKDELVIANNDRLVPILTSDSGSFGFQPKAWVSYRSIYGIDKPGDGVHPPNDSEHTLPEGSPYAIVGSSSVLEPWREAELRGVQAHISKIGGDVPGMVEDNIEYVGIYATIPTPFNNLRKNKFQATEHQRSGWSNAFEERIARYEQLIPIRKYQTPGGGIHLGPDPPAGSTPILRSDGELDSSFAAVIPGDQPFLFTLNDKDGNVLCAGQTWHALRPGETRLNCHGCHAHHRPDPLPLSATFAAKAEYPLPRLQKHRRVLSWKHDLAEFMKPLGFTWQSFGGGVFAERSRDREQTRGEDIAFQAIRTDWFKDPEAAGIGSLTQDQRQLLYDWMNEGILEEAPDAPDMANSDPTPPTLRVTLSSDNSEVLVGMTDPASGVDPATFQFKAHGRDYASEFERREGDIWHMPASMLGDGPHVVEVSVRDKNRSAFGSETGNEAKLTRLLEIGDVVDPPDPDPEPDPTDPTIDELLAEIQQLQADLEAQTARIDGLEDEVELLRDRLAAIRELTEF